MLPSETKFSIISEISSFLGDDSVAEFLQTKVWLKLDSGIWLVNSEQVNFLEAVNSDELTKSLKYAGIFIGKIRKNFGLSVESLQYLKPFIKRYIIIKGKTLQKYLYGKTITITASQKHLDNLEFQKIIVMTSEGDPVGISHFTILETRKENNEIIYSLKLEPITDLGMFLRKERSMFE